MKECCSLSVRAAIQYSFCAFVAGLLIYTTVRALASHQCGPGSNPGFDAMCGLNLLLVFSVLLREVFLWVLSFSPLLENQITNPNSTMDQVDEEPLCGCAISKSLFILFFNSFIHFLKFFWTITEDQPLM